MPKPLGKDAGAVGILTYEETNTDQGWYYFHHHHLHISLHGQASKPGAPVNQCLTPDCSPVDPTQGGCQVDEAHHHPMTLHFPLPTQ